jgi:2-keto-3-deoxy-L-arabinonate dehydratase
MDAPLTGVVPVVPTIFYEDETVDLDGTARVVEYLIDAGVAGLCLLANYSEQFSLTDAERDTIARTLLERVAGRVPVIVTTSHYSARVAAERSRAARDMGAAMVMLMPPFFGATLTVARPSVLDFYQRVADAIDIPIMVQDAPLSPTPLPVSLIVDLVGRVPRVQYVKIEVAQAAEKLHSLIGLLGPSLPGPFDGEESVTLIPDLDAGATGTMPSATAPFELGQIVRRYLTGDRAGAVSLWEGLLPLIHFENRQCGLRAQKILLAEGGIIDCDRTRAPLGPVPPRTRRGLVELAEARDLLIMRWGRLDRRWAPSGRRLRGQDRGVGPGEPQAERLAVEVGGIAMWRVDSDALHALAATGGVEGAGAGVRLQDPQVQAGAGGLRQDRLRGQGHQPGADAVALTPILDMQVVEERTPGGVLAEDRVREADDRAV